MRRAKLCAGIRQFGAILLGITSQRQPVRYLIAGAWNTAFAYGIVVVLYAKLSPQLATWEVALIANVLAISMSFLTYKLFVFRTHGNWLREYLRCYVAYGGMSIVSIALFTALVDGLRQSVWLAQALTILITVGVSYFAHKTFTFKGGGTDRT